MELHSIKNFNELATTENRKIALEIIEAGMDAINTEKVIKSSVILKSDVLSIGDKDFDLSKYKNIKVIGFGKSSPDAALVLEDVLGSKITKGAVVGLKKVPCRYIETFIGTHPRPSRENIEAGNKIFELLDGSTAQDLIIVLVSGGGSALLCYGEGECTEGAKLYDNFLSLGKTISEMNTVRKHLSLFKGGGLAKIAYPATVIGLIFSDVPGGDFASVASGPTYKDETSIKDAQKIIIENNLGNFDLIETPKEDKYFENVFNFVVVSNEIAINKMVEKAKEFNFETNIVSTELYDETNIALDKIFQTMPQRRSSGNSPKTVFGVGSVVLAAGEPSITVTKSGGKGGRNLHMGLLSIEKNLIDDDSVFISFASDGMDNSDAAGTVVDKNTVEKINKLGINVKDALENFDSYPVFEKSGDIIMTGPTGANVSDLMLLLKRK